MKKSDNLNKAYEFLINKVMESELHNNYLLYITHNKHTSKIIKDACTINGKFDVELADTLLSNINGIKELSVITNTDDMFIDMIKTAITDSGDEYVNCVRIKLMETLFGDANNLKISDEELQKSHEKFIKENDRLFNNLYYLIRDMDSMIKASYDEEFAKELFGNFRRKYIMSEKEKKEGKDSK